MEDSTEAYLNALQEIIFALTKGLETTIAVIENPEKFKEVERNLIIEKLKELVEASRKVYGTEATIH